MFLHIAARAMFKRRFALSVMIALSGALVVSKDMAWPFLHRWWLELPFQNSEGQDGVLFRDYRVDIEGLKLPDLTDLSGITFNKDRNTLFAVTNNSPVILELSLDGRLIRRIPTRGLQDPEAIEHLGDERYLVADERIQTLFEVRITDSTSVVDVDQSARLSIGVELSGNKGFEGLAYDEERRRIFVAKEKRPRRIYEVSGFPVNAGKVLNIQILQDARSDRRLPLRDISSLHFDAETRHLLVLSDESRRIIELDRKKQVIRSFPLTSGWHGLTKDIPQPEGITMDNEGNIYVVSEPDLFYRFVRNPEHLNQLPAR